MSDNVVYTFPKNRREEIRASLGEYRGHRLADVRVYVTDEDGTDIPTKKGVSVRFEDLPKLRAAVDALIAAAESEESLAA